ncbi:MAG: ABC transporter permease [Chloroflexi bacterium]|nr:ABC transporter permease [Chloroflexota bacterium]
MSLSVRFYLGLLPAFIRASIQEAVAYRANFWISLLHASLNFATGVLGLVVLFGQVEQIRGWDLPAALALLGIFLTLGSLRGLVFGPSLDSLAGLEGDVWSGRLDYTLLRPVWTQYLVSVRRWQPLALLDLIPGIALIAVAFWQLRLELSAADAFAFLVALGAALLILYALLLAATALIFWAPGVLFTWIFDSIFQMARYPLGLYPGWVRLLLTWVVPVGLITTVPAEALTGRLDGRLLLATVALALLLTLAASILFRRALARYESVGQ